MQILDGIFGAHCQRLQQSLSKTAERQRLLVGNLANVNTPGYKRKDMDFAVVLDEAKDQVTQLQSTVLPSAHGETPSEDGRSISSDGNSVDMESEVAAITETQLHFGAVSMMSKRFFQGLKEVIREGK